MSTLTNYEGLLALSTSPHLSQAMRGYLVDVLAEHREMRAALIDCVAVVKAWHGEEVWDIYYDHSPEMKSTRAILAKVQP